MSSVSRYAVWTGWLLIGVSFVVSAITIPVFVSDLKDVLAQSRSSGIDDRLMNVQPENRTWLLEQHGGHWGQHGWYLTGGEKGDLRILLPGTETGTLKLRLWLFSPGHLSVSRREGSTRQAIPLHDLDGRILQIHVHGPSELIVESSSDLVEEQLVMDRYAAVWFPPESQLPSLLPIAVILALMFAGWACTLVHHPSGSTVWMAMFGAGVILLAVMVGFHLRWDLFDIARGLPADPDAGTGGYYTHAMNFTWLSPSHGFYSGNFNGREPFHVAALSVWLHLWGEYATAVRLYTIFLSTILIVASGIFIWRLSGRMVLGVAAASIVALSPAWVDESVRGLRLETISLLLLAVLSVWIWANGWLGAALLGMLSGFMALVQSFAIAQRILALHHPDAWSRSGYPVCFRFRFHPGDLRDQSQAG